MSITKSEKKIMYAMMNSSRWANTERQIRSAAGYASSKHAVLNGLIRKGYLSTWKHDGKVLYHFSNKYRKNPSAMKKLKNEVRPKYYCRSCKKYHWKDSDIGNMHKRYTA